MEKTTVVITGASGLLGRSLFSKFSNGSLKKVIGTAFSRSVYKSSLTAKKILIVVDISTSMHFL